MRTYTLHFLVAFLSFKASAQGLKEYVDLSVSHAWSYQQGVIHLRMAEAKWLDAKSAFDPSLSWMDRGKQTDAQTAYRYQETQLKIPVMGGVSILGMGQWGNGPWLNPESKVPMGGLAGVGVSFPVGPQIWFSESQQKVEMAALQVDIARADLEVLKQEVTKHAVANFIEWSLAYREMEAYAESLSRLESQLVQMRSAFTLGGVARKDTLELSAYRELRKSQYLEALQAEVAAFQRLRTFAGSSAVNVSWQPLHFEVAALGAISFLHKLLIERAPKFNLLQAKQEQAETNSRFERAQRWNVPDISLNVLQYADSFNPYGSAWKVSWELPVLNRKNRAERQLANLYLEELALNQEFLFLEFKNRQVQWELQLPVSLKNMQTMEEQASIYLELWELEEQSFELGYSSVFMKNQRELAYLDAQIKRNKAVGSHYKLLTEWAALTGQHIEWP